MEQLKRWREERGLSQVKLAQRADLNPATVNQIERGAREASPGTLHKLADALDISLYELLEGEPRPLAQAPPSAPEAEAAPDRTKMLNAAEEARRLRETGWAQMWRVLSEWRASKNRGEPYSTRRKYLDEMGNLLQEVRDADDALGWAYAEAGLTPPGAIEASLPSYLREESRKTSHFYGELLGLAKSARLSVITGEDADAAKQAATEHVQSEMRPLRVEEPAA